MREWIEKPDGSKHAPPSPWEIVRQEKQQAEDIRLRDEALGLRAPLKGKQRTALYSPPEPIVRPRTAHAPAINTATWEFLAVEPLTLEVLAEQRVLAENSAALNMEVFCQGASADQQTLLSCGFRMSGVCNKNEHQVSIVYQRWRLCIRTGR
jgi:hypothetical protein